MRKFNWILDIGYARRVATIVRETEDKRELEGDEQGGGGRQRASSLSLGLRRGVVGEAGRTKASLPPPLVPGFRLR